MNLPINGSLAPSVTEIDDEGRHEFIQWVLEHDSHFLDSWHTKFFDDNYTTKKFSPAQRQIIDRWALKFQRQTTY